MKRSYLDAEGKDRTKTAAIRERQIRYGEMKEGLLTLQVPLPILEIMDSTRDVLTEVSLEVGRVIAQALLDDEVAQRAGVKHGREPGLAYRWGREGGHVVMAGQKVPLRRPRLRAEGQEVVLSRYGAMKAAERMEGAVTRRLINGVSTRKYGQVVEEVAEGFGIAKSSVSRQFVAATAKQLAELCERPLGNLNLAAILIDGKVYGDLTVIVALGIDQEGRKYALGIWDGATENTTTVTALVKDLERRGLDLKAQYLFVVDGAKALAKGIRSTFGEASLIQRCQLHKRRNVAEHLPAKWQNVAEQRLKVAYGMKSYAEAEEALRKTVAWLRTISEGAARSLEEGLEETLTLHKLDLPDVLRRTLSTTNAIESCLSQVEDLSGRVKRWRSVQMIRRWVGGMLLVAEGKFKRIRGHKSLPVLMDSLLPNGAVAVRAVGA